VRKGKEEGRRKTFTATWEEKKKEKVKVDIFPAQGEKRGGNRIFPLVPSKEKKRTGKKK